MTLETTPAEGAATAPLKGAAARVVSNMESSLAVPTATSVRAVPASTPLVETLTWAEAAT